MRVQVGLSGSVLSTFQGKTYSQGALSHRSSSTEELRLHDVAYLLQDVTDLL